MTTSVRLKGLSGLGSGCCPTVPTPRRCRRSRRRSARGGSRRRCTCVWPRRPRQQVGEPAPASASKTYSWRAAVAVDAACAGQDGRRAVGRLDQPGVGGRRSRGAAGRSRRRRRSAPWWIMTIRPASCSRSAMSWLVTITVTRCSRFRSLMKSQDVPLGQHVQAEGRLVEEEDLRLVQQRQRQLGAHALAQAQLARQAAGRTRRARAARARSRSCVVASARDIPDDALPLEAGRDRVVPPELGALAEDDADPADVARPLAHRVHPERPDRPASGASRPESSLTVVLLPAPFGPA